MAPRRDRSPDDEWRRFRHTGAPDALGAVFDLLSPELFRIALSLTPDATSAEDALQETWLTALHAAENHDLQRPVVPWLVGILRLKVHEVRRAGRRPDERRIRPAPPVEDPADAAAASDETERLRAEIEALPERYREVAVLRWRYGLEPAEIADARGMSPGTVRSLLHRAVERLRKRIGAAPAVLIGLRLPGGLELIRANLMHAAQLTASAATAGAGGGLFMATATKVGMAVAATALVALAIAIESGPTEGDTRIHSATVVDVEAIDDVAGAEDATREHVAVTKGDERADQSESAGRPFAHGVVVDETDAPIAGARVVVRGHEMVAGDRVEAAVPLDADAAVLTAHDGSFTLLDEPLDVASLTIFADGFLVEEVRTYVEDARIVLTRCEPFEGRVIDTEGRPIANVGLYVQSPFGEPPDYRRIWVVARTDSTGRFILRSPPRDAFVTQLLAPGYRLPELRNQYGVELLSEYVLVRQRIFVDISDAATGEPVSSARGVVARDDGAILGVLSGGSAWTAGGPDAGRPDGRLFWNPLREAPEGPVTVQIRAEGYVPETRVVSFESGREPPHIAVSLQPGTVDAALAGYVINGAGARVDVRLSATRPDGRRFIQADADLPLAASTVAGSAGEFRVAGLPAGSYVVMATRPGSPVASVRVDIPALSVELRFPTRAALGVSLRDEGGAPVADTWIHVQTTDERRHWDSKTDRSGRAEFPGLPAVEVDVLPIHNEGIVVGGTRVCRPCPGERVTLSPEKPTRVDLVWPNARRLTVSVRDDQGVALRDASVSVKLHGGLMVFQRKERARIEHLELFTDADGLASLDLLPARGVIHVISFGRRVSAKFTLGEDGAGAVEIVVPTITGRVVGRVVESGTGAAVAGRPVSAYGRGRSVASAITDSEGRFALSGIPSGSVRVSVRGRGSAERRVDPESPYPSASLEIELGRGEERTLELSIPRVRGEGALPRSTHLTARVVDEKSAPVAGAFVLVFAELDGMRVMLGSVEVDAEGLATCDVARAARYEIEAFKGSLRAVRTWCPQDVSEVVLVLAPEH